MNDKEIKRIISEELEVPAAVDAKMRGALNMLSAGTYLGAPTRVKPSPRRRVAIVAIAAVLVVALSGIALAASGGKLGIFDFLNRGEQVLPGATELVETPQIGIFGDGITFNIREFLYDGETVYAVVEVAPPDADTLLIGEDSMRNDPISDLGPQFAGDMTPISEYAAARGMKIVHTGVGFDMAAMGMDTSSGECRLEADGTLVYMLSGQPRETEQLIIQYNWAEVAADGSYIFPDYFEGGRTPATLSVPMVGTPRSNAIVETECAVDFADLGVRVDKLTLELTPMAAYYRIDYTITNAALFDSFTVDGMGVAFSFLDENGNVIQSIGGGAMGRDPGDATRGIEQGSLPAMSELPKSVTLRGFNAGLDWGSAEYEAHEITISQD
jgi:hypothetical protein